MCDILIAGASVVVLSPVLLVTALSIRLEDGGPVLFRQRRVGRNGVPFSVIKFRSMLVNTGDIPSAEAGSAEITKVGEFIRRTNIDELPQLFNVVKGEMSIVGPRPPLPAQRHLCELRAQNGSLACKPGLTGLAQINSYDGMPEREKAEWDGRYASSVCFLADVGIVVRTFGYLLRRPPVY
ncbi:MAG: sugar transferase [Planctomycetota bacterium]